MIEANLLWHRNEAGDRGAFAKGLNYWTREDLDQLYELIEDELMHRDNCPQEPMHQDIIDLWLGPGQ